MECGRSACSARRPRRTQGRLAGPCCKHCLSSPCDVLDCAGRAQRRRRFGSHSHGCSNADLIRSTPAESKAAWRFTSRRTPKTLARSTNGPVANTPSPARATSWTAPAERSGDGALDRLPTAVEPPGSFATCAQNPKRRGASLPAALQDAGAMATVAGRSARFWRYAGRGSDGALPGPERRAEQAKAGSRFACPRTPKRPAPRPNVAHPTLPSVGLRRRGSGDPACLCL